MHSYSVLHGTALDAARSKATPATARATNSHGVIVYGHASYARYNATTAAMIARDGTGDVRGNAVRPNVYGSTTSTP